jgi:hypothetical protein
MLLSLAQLGARSEMAQNRKNANTQKPEEHASAEYQVEE